ncbi:MAG: EAL domain-containing protein [Rhodospirillales bacterium]|nr:EAL domain-containing protein [Rhodospirillales bacterium]
MNKHNAPRLRSAALPASSAGSGAAPHPDTLIDLMSIIERAPERQGGDRLRLADAIFESAADGILILGPDLKVIAMNPAFAATSGYEAREVVGRVPEFMATAARGANFLKHVGDALASQGAWKGEVWVRHRDGGVHPGWWAIRSIFTAGGDVAYYLALSGALDFGPRANGDRGVRLANFDPLTGLANKRLVRELVEKAFTGARDGKGFAVLYADLDSFGAIVERWGHRVGDQVLFEIARRMNGVLRKCDSLGRLGGDDFVVILPGVESETDVAKVARSLLDAVAVPLPVDGPARELAITASIGAAVYPKDGGSAASILHRAEVASAYAKEHARGSWQFFTDEVGSREVPRLSLEASLQHAVERNEFVLHFQPKFDLRLGRIVGVEALIRWQKRGHGLVPPAGFIPLAEETGLINEIGDWALRAACRQAKSWSDAGLPPMRMAVNLSARQLSKEDLLSGIVRILEKTGLPPNLLEIEVTESALMEKAVKGIAALRALREMGVHLTADDFGVGYSSLNYLKNLPLDSIKIDRAFVAEIGGQGDGAMLAGAVIGLAQSLEKRVVAEGVEQRNQLEFLRQHWCDEAQGYLFSRPLPADEFERFVRERPRL